MRLEATDNDNVSSQVENLVRVAYRANHSLSSDDYRTELTNQIKKEADVQISKGVNINKEEHVKEQIELIKKIGDALPNEEKEKISTSKNQGESHSALDDFMILRGIKKELSSIENLDNQLSENKTLNVDGDIKGNITDFINSLPDELKQEQKNKKDEVSLIRAFINDNLNSSEKVEMSILMEKSPDFKSLVKSEFEDKTKNHSDNAFKNTDDFLDYKLNVLNLDVNKLSDDKKNLIIDELKEKNEKINGLFEKNKTEDKVKIEQEQNKVENKESKISSNGFDDFEKQVKNFFAVEKQNDNNRAENIKLLIDGISNDVNFEAWSNRLVEKNVVSNPEPSTQSLPNKVIKFIKEHPSQDKTKLFKTALKNTVINDCKEILKQSKNTEVKTSIQNSLMKFQRSQFREAHSQAKEKISEQEELSKKKGQKQSIKV